MQIKLVIELVLINDKIINYDFELQIKQLKNYKNW